jgi:hypothetical protein
MIYLNSNKFNKGYTLLFSIIVASIVLSIAAFILSVSRKQFILSSAARDSTIAIYAADSGIQCAVEAYKSGTNLATSSPATIGCNNNLNPSGAYSNFKDLTIATDMGLDSSITIYQSAPIIIKLPPGNPGDTINTCAIVIVTQGYYDNGSGGYSHKTIIDSRGYNIANSGPCDSSRLNPLNPRAVERAIRLIYRD